MIIGTGEIFVAQESITGGGSDVCVCVLIVVSYCLMFPRAADVLGVPKTDTRRCLFLCRSRFFAGDVVEFPCIGVRAMVSVPTRTP